MLYSFPKAYNDYIYIFNPSDFIKNYFNVTEAPTSSNWAFNASASSLAGAGLALLLSGTALLRKKKNNSEI